MTTPRLIQPFRFARRSRIALAASLVAAAVALPASTAFAAAAPAWSVTDTVSSPTTAPSTGYLTQGDGLQGGYDLGAVASWPNLDTVNVTVANTGSTASSGTVTATLTFASGITPADILNSWVTSTGVVTAGSPTVTSVDTTNAGYPFAVGEVVTGTGIPSTPPTTITGVSGASPNITLTLSASATASSAATGETLTVLPGEGTTSTGMSSVTGVTGGPYAVGNSISGTGIASGTTITGVSGTSPNITLTLSSSATASGTVALTEAATRVAATGSGWTCTNASPEVCTTSNTANAGASFPVITLPVQVTATAGAGLQQAGGGQSGAHVNFEPSVTGGGAATATLPFIPIAIEGIANLTSVDVPNGAFRQGDTTDSYSLYVTNTGVGQTNTSTPNPNTGTSNNPIVVTETIPTGETAGELYGAGWTCNLNATTAGVGGAQYTLPADSCYTLENLPWGSDLPVITLVVGVASNATTPQSLSTKVSGGDTEAGSTSVSTSTTVQQSADVIVDSVHVGNFDEGDANDQYYLYTRDIVGPNSAAGGPTYGPVTVVDTAPVGMTITSMSGPGWSCTLTPATLVQPPTTALPNVLEPADSCTRSDALAVNTNYPNITVDVSVSNTAQSGGNTVTVSGGDMTAASAGGGQSFTDTTTVNGEPDLTIDALQSQNGAVAPSVVWTQGDGASAGDAFLLTASNYGYAPTSGTITVIDTLPSSVSLVSTSTPATGSGWSCSVGSSDHIVTCTSSASAAAGTALPTITVPVTVSPTATTSPINNVVVSGGSEINTSNDYDDEVAEINQLPDLTVELSDSGSASFTQGGAASFYVDVTNLNQVGTTAPITLTDTVSSGLTITSVTEAPGTTGWSCSNTATSASCGTSNVLNPLGTAAFVVSVSVASNATSPISDTATVAGGGEIVTSNDTATDTTSVVGHVVPSVATSNDQGPPPNASSTAGTGAGSTTAGTSAGSTTAATTGTASTGAASTDSGSQAAGSQAAGSTPGGTAGSTATGAGQVAAGTHLPPPRGLTRLLSRWSGRYAVSGRLLLPAGLSRGSACTGTVAVLIDHGSSVVARGTAHVTPSCTYSVSGSLSSRAARTGLVISTTFSGNSVLAA